MHGIDAKVTQSNAKEHQRDNAERCTEWEYARPVLHVLGPRRETHQPAIRARCVGTPRIAPDPGWARQCRQLRHGRWPGGRWPLRKWRRRKRQRGWAWRLQRAWWYAWWPRWVRGVRLWRWRARRRRWGRCPRRMAYGWQPSRIRAARLVARCCAGMARFDRVHMVRVSVQSPDARRRTVGSMSPTVGCK